MLQPTDEPGTTIATLANGVRVVMIACPAWARSVSVFVRTGSAHEGAKLNGISHVVEHMASGHARTRDCQRINLDAERLGAEVNAHTDKDHTAFHMRGLADDARASCACSATSCARAPSPPTSWSASGA